MSGKGSDNTNSSEVRKDRVVTTVEGLPINEPFATQRVGQNGPLLMQDSSLIELLAHFNRERIPERNLMHMDQVRLGILKLPTISQTFVDLRCLVRSGKRPGV